MGGGPGAPFAGKVPSSFLAPGAPFRPALRYYGFMSENKLNPTGYDLQFEKSGPDHYTSRDNNFVVAKVADRLWVIVYLGNKVATTTSKKKAMDWAAGKQARILGLGN